LVTLQRTKDPKTLDTGHTLDSSRARIPIRRQTREILFTNFLSIPNTQLCQIKYEVVSEVHIQPYTVQKQSKLGYGDGIGRVVP
jgi:hypothetical protein